MTQKFVTRWFYASVGKFEDVKTVGFLPWNRRAVKTVEDSYRTANYDEFAKQLEHVYNELDELGYDVHQVLPLNIGASEPNHAVMDNGRKNYLGDVGFSVTRGAIVIGRLRG